MVMEQKHVKEAISITYLFDGNLRAHTSNWELRFDSCFLQKSRNPFDNTPFFHGFRRQDNATTSSMGGLECLDFTCVP